MKYNFRQIRKRFCAVSIALATLVVSAQISGINVMAGASDIVIDNTSFENGIDPSDYSTDKMMRNAQSYMSNMPNMPQMPKIDIPKF